MKIWMVVKKLVHGYSSVESEKSLYGVYSSLEEAIEAVKNYKYGDPNENNCGVVFEEFMSDNSIMCMRTMSAHLDDGSLEILKIEVEKTPLDVDDKFLENRSN